MGGFDLDHYLSLPRVSGLSLSPSGDRLVVGVSTVGAKGTSFVTSLWEVDPDGQRSPRRLTRSRPGESGGVFVADGGVAFTTARPDPDVADDPLEELPGLWLLPLDGAEARPVLLPPGGVDAVAAARDVSVVALGVPAHPGATTTEEDLERAKARKDAGVSAQLFEDYPIRLWDHYLGPRQRRIGVLDLDSGEVRELLDGAGRSLDNVDFGLTPDGATLVTGYMPEGATGPTDLLAVDVTSGERRVLAADGTDHVDVQVSHDGSTVACVRAERGDTTSAGRRTLLVIDLASGEERTLAPDLDLWPGELRWAPDGSTLFFCADELGHRPAFRVDVENGSVTRLAANGAFHSLCPSPDGAHLYALRSSMTSPPEVVVLDPTEQDQEPKVLPTPGHPLDVPGVATQVVAEASDGTPVYSWLVLPEGASADSPAPLVTFIHGGPLGSWNDWSWRWNPHLLAARGYAVLLPDPALSTGYGQAFINRGRGRWGETPYTDLMSCVDAAVARPDIDATRTAAMGGSFGGYMANWIAGHTDRFRCIVTHASLWALDQFHGTTDVGIWWEREFGDPYAEPERYEANSPHRHVGSIKTPMLVIHGELDHRVPVGEALRLWTDLRRHDVEAKFLYFPDENHWILKPQNARVWYETVFAWLDEHLLEKEWVQPALL